MLVAVAVREAIAFILSPLASRLSPITIKWPNDIYYQDKKLVGILIENILSGRHIAYTIAGVGVNVNQTQWLSNAPNPVSMKQITGEEYDVENLLNTFLSSIQRWQTASTEQLKEEYVRHLYRSTGWHPYIEREVSVAPTNIQLATQASDGVFLAQWVDITPQGEWVLQLKTGEQKRYHFKQIRFVL
jgi:BirA family biotin operon repressor/biotin-[acetyl-CoA-carboxylase] ligase